MGDGALWEPPEGGPFPPLAVCWLNRYQEPGLHLHSEQLPIAEAPGAWWVAPAGQSSQAGFLGREPFLSADIHLPGALKPFLQQSDFCPTVS